MHCKCGLSGESLAKLLLTKISNLDLSINYCRSQGYDGAAAVSGKISGLSAHILNSNKEAIYSHCHRHRLNLSVRKSCSAGLVRNVLEQIKEMSYFFNLSQNRQQLLENNVESYFPESRKSTLKDVCQTR